MAEHRIIGGNVLLFIDPLGGTAYDTVVCLTSVAVNDSVGEVDASSACGPAVSPGALALSVSFDGYHLQDPATGKVSGTSLRALLRAKTLVGYKIGPVTPITGDEIESGTAYITSLSSTYAFNDDAKFSGTLKPQGLPTVVITA